MQTYRDNKTLTMPCRTAPAISSSAPWFWRRTRSRSDPDCVWGRIRGTTGRKRESKNIHVINAKHTHTHAQIKQRQTPSSKHQRRSNWDYRPHDGAGGLQDWRNAIIKSSRVILLSSVSTVLTFASYCSWCRYWLHWTNGSDFIICKIWLRFEKQISFLCAI